MHTCAQGSWVAGIKAFAGAFTPEARAGLDGSGCRSARCGSGGSVLRLLRSAKVPARKLADAVAAVPIPEPAGGGGSRRVRRKVERD